MKLALIDIDTLALCQPAQVLCLTYLLAEINLDSAKTVKYVEGRRNTVVFGVGKDKQPGLADKSTIEYHKNMGHKDLLNAAARLTPEDNTIRLQALSARFRDCQALMFTQAWFQVPQLNILLHAYGQNQMFNCLDLKTIIMCCTTLNPEHKLKKSKTVTAMEILSTYSSLLGHSGAVNFLYHNNGR
jgi:hypothetical protein